MSKLTDKERDESSGLNIALAREAIMLAEAGDSRKIAARLRDPVVALTMAERTFLAAFVSGEISKPRHRPPSPVVGKRRRFIVLEVAQLEAQGNTTKQAIG